MPDDNVRIRFEDRYFNLVEIIYIVKEGMTALSSVFSSIRSFFAGDIVPFPFAFARASKLGGN